MARPMAADTDPQAHGKRGANGASFSFQQYLLITVYTSSQTSRYWVFNFKLRSVARVA
jgi:hypothetical protein